MNVADEHALEELQVRLKAHGCEVTDVVDHEFMRSIYFTDNNGIALEASWWVTDATGRDADYGDDRLFADTDPVPAVAEIAAGRLGVDRTADGARAGADRHPRSRLTPQMAQVIKINAITVPAESGDELAKRFAHVRVRSTTRTASKDSNCCSRPTIATSGWS